MHVYNLIFYYAFPLRILVSLFTFFLCTCILVAYVTNVILVLYTLVAARVAEREVYVIMGHSVAVALITDTVEYNTSHKKKKQTRL